MNKLGIGLWGLGKHACNRILPALLSSRELSLIGVCSRSKKKVKEVAQRWNCNGWIEPNEMLNNTKINVIYIASPIGVHFKMAMQALEAGKNVWCEKPLTCNYEETKKLVKFAKRNKRMLTEAFMYLYHPQFKKVKKFINDANTGKIHSIICRFGIPILQDPGFRNDSNLGGGAFWDVGSYLVSAIIALMPDQNPHILFSEINKKVNFPVDTNGRTLLRFSNGTTAYLEWGTGIGYKNEIDIWSQSGSFFTDKIFSKPKNYKCIYKIRDQNGNEILKYEENADQFINMFYNFYNMISSPSLIEDEYSNIIERSRVMNEIMKNSSLVDK